MPQGDKLSLPLTIAANSKLIALDRLPPLGTSGRNIVDRNGTKVQLKCVNWYGAHMELYSVFGLHKRPLVELSERIADWGFNCVRMPISIDLWYKDPPVPAFALAANPELQALGLSGMQLLDKPVRARPARGCVRPAQRDPRHADAHDHMGHLIRHSHRLEGRHRGSCS